MVAAQDGPPELYGGARLAQQRGKLGERFYGGALLATSYTYDLLNHVTTEATTTPGAVANRNMTYQYDALGQLTRWADSVTGDNLNSLYDAEGNVMEEYTDTGYNPLGQNTDGGGNNGGSNSTPNPNYRYIDHVYTYDGDRRVTSEVQRSRDASGNVSDAIINAYTYDADSNRLTWNNQGVMVSYGYDQNDRVTLGTYFTGGDLNQQQWTYDAMGNVLSYATTLGSLGRTTSSTVSTYNKANRQVTSNHNGQVATNTYDLSLRITQTVIQNQGSTFYYNYSYYGDGREKGVVAYGDANGNSVETYDANKMEIRVDLGQGSNQVRPEFKTFSVDNQGHIIYELHDDGKSAQNETDQFVYANGKGVAQNTHGTDGTYKVQLDTGTYGQIQNFGDSNPGINLTYTVQAGDTLQGIASQMYGNSSLWFVIADANGLNAGDQLKAGTVLIVPNTIKSGTITADNHTVYSETQITGSTLPNLKSPPPPSSDGGCGSILSIIIVVVVAIVVAVVTAGVGAALVDALGISSTALGTAGAAIATAATYAVAGAVVGAVGSIVQQGLFIALGYQKKFSWKQVAGGAAAGAFAGAALGVGALLKAGQIVGEVAVQYARVAEGALGALGQAAQEIIDNGKITSWTGLAVAAAGGYFQGAAEAAGAPGATADVVAAGKEATELLKDLKYVSPWVQLAETYARKGSLAPADWATAVGGTLSQAVVNNFGAQDSAAQTVEGRLENAALRLGTSALVAGALSAYDKKAALSYFENSVGHEVGEFLGSSIQDALEPYLPKLTPVASGVATRSGQADSNAEDTATAPKVQTAARTEDKDDAVVRDSNGNPVAPINTPSAANGSDDTGQQAQTAPLGSQVTASVATQQQTSPPDPQAQLPAVAAAGETPQPDPQTSPQAAPVVANAPAPVPEPTPPPVTAEQIAAKYWALPLGPIYGPFGVTATPYGPETPPDPTPPVPAAAGEVPPTTPQETNATAPEAPALDPRELAARFAALPPGSRVLLNSNDGVTDSRVQAVQSFLNSVYDSLPPEARAFYDTFDRRTDEIINFVSSQYSAYQKNEPTFFGKVATGVSNFVSSEYETAKDNGIDRTQSVQFLSQKLDEALTPGTRLNLALFLVAPGVTSAVDAYQISTGGNVSDQLTNDYKNAEDYFNNHSWQEIRYDAASVAANFAFDYVLLDGAGKVISVGAKGLEALGGAAATLRDGAALVRNAEVGGGVVSPALDAARAEEAVAAKALGPNAAPVAFTESEVAESELALQKSALEGGSEAPGRIAGIKTPIIEGVPEAEPKLQALYKLTERERDALLDLENPEPLALLLGQGRIEALESRPWLMQRFFGSALQVRVTEAAKSVPELADLVPTTSGSAVDFTFEASEGSVRAIAEQPVGLEITGNGASTVSDHLGRIEVDGLVTYRSIPEGFGRWWVDAYKDFKARTHNQ
jgi:hypothetical protein